jgi:CheY-like chemotaxis protein
MKPLKVLVAEDIHIHKTLLDYMLRSIFNIQDITWAANGEQARHYLEKTLQNKEPFDLVIMDFGLPILNGSQVIKDY